MEQENRRLRILLIDDDAESRVLLMRTLSKFGYELVCASNAPDGLGILRMNPDIVLVLLDSTLSGTSGLDTLKEIGSAPKAPPVMMMSATSSKSQVLAAIKAGAVDFILKPVNVGKLILKINTVVDKYCASSQDAIPAAQDLALEAETHFTFQDISETGCAIRSSFPLQQNSILVLESRELTERLNLPADRTFPVRIANCVPVKTGKGYQLGAQFVGLTEDCKRQLRVACTSAKGFKA